MADGPAAATVPRPHHFYTEPAWLDVGDVHVAYRRKGTGEPTLYLHGAGMTRMWLPHLETMSQHVDVIAPEHPGYGETEMAEEVIPHFREPDGKPSYAREEPLGTRTLTEHAATVKQPELQPVARLNGSLVETQRAYLEELAET